MITAWNVLARLEHFIDIDSDSKDKALSICFANLEKVFSMLNDKADKNDCRITQAAAGMSYYDLAVNFASDGKDSITQFKAGDVSISNSSQSLIEIASEIKKDSLKQLLPLLKDENFFITLA